MVRKTRSHTYIIYGIYIPYFALFSLGKFFAGRLAELSHTLHALYLAVGKEKERQAEVKEIRIVISIVV